MSFFENTRGSPKKPKVVKTRAIQVTQPMVRQLRKSVSEKNAEVNKMKDIIDMLQKRVDLLEKMTSLVLSFENLKHDDTLLKYYTGICNSRLFEVLMKYISPLLKENLKSKLSKENQVLLCLVKLRLGLENKDLTSRFGVHLSTVPRIFSKTVTVMANVFKHFIADPDKEKVQKSLPAAFKKIRKFRNTRLIINCTEIFIERPQPLIARAQTYSNYKSHNTLKMLIACTPTGGICFLSQAWGGRVSDIQLIRESGFYNMILPNDVVLADRGFPIADDLGALGARLSIPAFTKGKLQLTGKEVEESRQIAQVRIHIERCIRRFKTFGILQGVMPSTII